MPEEPPALDDKTPFPAAPIDRPHALAPPPGAPVPAWKKYLGPLAFVAIAIFKFGAKLKFLLIPLAKFFPVLLKTGGTMILSV